MASRISLICKNQWKYPFDINFTGFKNDEVNDGVFPIISKGNIIEGIEAKE